MKQLIGRMLFLPFAALFCWSFIQSTIGFDFINHYGDGFYTLVAIVAAIGSVFLLINSFTGDEIDGDNVIMSMLGKLFFGLNLMGYGAALLGMGGVFLLVLFPAFASPMFGMMILTAYLIFAAPVIYGLMSS